MVIGIWGTGSSALTAVQTLDLSPSRIFSSTGGGNFLGIEVEPGERLDSSIDVLFVCSMYYPEILAKLEDLKFPVDRVRVYHSHRIHPEYVLNEVIDPTRDPWGQSYACEISESRTPGVRAIEGRLEHLEFAFKKAPSRGLVLEFGVWRGESLFHLQSFSDRVVYGFDSMAGFEREDQAGLRFHGFSPLPSNLLAHPGLIEGWFDETLPEFLLHHTDRIAFVHYDANDLTAVRFVLKAIFPRLESGAVLVFDEMLVTDDADVGTSHEWDALHEAVREVGASFQWLGRSGSSASVMVRN